ncbi:hypothetical protein Curi_c02310 [Gottschalkia acidurici 9a]|uniref:Uncharacterized protein n=1 Tax=Gottschalkia acidurici (strain ATCC 7906 / DSM 604 / BCRC 14475 / CIP 104303 / KCTC 5404 / NCIMB 10678 / 9a) TaxID=1128398 RepID=K0AY48_GOTA9|nr:hypothetical protein [Gottschalkia acidurici]AFS77311.1 hypothetical protein Curi_c02310 [Gottschalkia acidurici 9a]
MDIMKFIDFALVGVPETTMMLLIGLLLGYGKGFYKRLNFLMFRVVIATVLILCAIFFVRSRLTSIQAIGMSSLLIYIVTFKSLFGMNIRKSIVTGSLAIFIISATEIVTFPILKYIAEGKYFEDRFNVTLITRIIQFIILICLHKFEISLTNISAVSRGWYRLKTNEKITSIFVMLLLMLCVIFNTSYSDLCLKINMNTLNSKDLNINMTIYFIENLLFIAVTVYILNRTKDYYKYEEILLKGEDELLLRLLDATDDSDTIRRYIRLCEAYLEKSIKEVK